MKLLILVLVLLSIQSASAQTTAPADSTAWDDIFGANPCGGVRPLNLAEIRQAMLPLLVCDTSGCVTGKLVVRVLVGKAGEALQMKVLRSPCPLDEAAIWQVLRQLCFEPQCCYFSADQPDGAAVKSWVVIPFKMGNP